MAKSQLRKMLADGESFFVPAVWDSLTARLARHAGLKALYLSDRETGIFSGDGNLTTLTQAVVAAETALEAVADSLPMIVDAHSDSEVLARHVVRNFEDAGVSGINLCANGHGSKETEWLASLALQLLREGVLILW